ncbi:MAG: N-acetyl-alpha-D-glucosaminyl L-malate synthase BshA [Phycisphaerae bacterium]|nr:N-acetyl-alpha-D-glucosaminyl L-malate synthase BshA [Phycisphaerae bacterium]
MAAPSPLHLRIGITCYPSVGGSGILATSLGEELALRGHEVHFISYERPFRLKLPTERISFHPVEINDYGLFKYPDYTLPLSVKMAEVAAQHKLDILHVHYAVPHATAAILARSMLPESTRPKVVTTLHGTDTTLLGKDPGYAPALRHALASSDALTAVSTFLANETRRLLDAGRAIEVIPNFIVPRTPLLTREQVRADLGIAADQTLLIHSSNLRPGKRIDLLLESVALLPNRDSFRLLILAGESFEPHRALARRLGLESQILVRERVAEVEEFMQAADLSLITSESESFCLSILEAMWFGCPSISTNVGGIPEVIQSGHTGVLVPFGDPSAFAHAIEDLKNNPARRAALGQAARASAHAQFSAAKIVPRYETLYRRMCDERSANDSIETKK